MRRIGLLIGALLVAVASLGVLGAGQASAQQPLGEIDAQYFYGEDADVPRWLRHSIIVCAARTMDVEVERVKLGLRHGHSLKEIGIRAGVRPVELENGILRCERNLLVRLVNAGDLSPSEARRIFNFLQEHITRIINYKWAGSDAA